jgi:hypothetical protein
MRQHLNLFPNYVSTARAGISKFARDVLYVLKW